MNYISEVMIILISYKKNANFYYFLFILLFIIIIAFNFMMINTLIVEAEAGQDSIKKQKLTIAFVPRSLDNPIFLDAFVASQQKARELGVRLEWIAPFSYSVKGQVEVIENLIRRDVDGMVISVDDVEPIHNIINKSLSQGIPVATFDADSPGSNRLFHIGIDNTRAGLEIGKALVGVIEEKGLSEKELDTMIMSGTPDALNLKERIIGFKEAIGGKINLNIQDIVYNYDNVKLSIEMVEDYLKKHPDIDIIYFTGGWPFYVPAEAMPNFQKWAQKGGIAVGIDIFYNALVLQQEGLIQHLVGQDLTAMGAEGLEYMVDYIKTGELPSVFVEVGIEHANSKNLDHLLEIYEPWLVK